MFVLQSINLKAKLCLLLEDRRNQLSTIKTQKAHIKNQYLPYKATIIIMSDLHIMHIQPMLIFLSLSFFLKLNSLGLQAVR